MNFEKFKDKLLFVPIGGCNFIGSNMYLYYYNETWVAMDCGIGFVDKNHVPGIDVLMPNMAFLEKYNIKLSALIITHAHEDHIGAVAYLEKYFQCPIYLTTFAKHFLQYDFEEIGINRTENIFEIKDGNRKFKIGEMEFEFFPMTHSILEANAIVVRTENGNIFHTGDWKFDDHPVISGKIDFEKLKKIGEEGNLTVICDSTNIEREMENQDEGLLLDSIYNLVKEQKGKVLLTTFSSNISRIYTVAEVAKKTQRKLIIAGRSLHRLIQISQSAGYLKDLIFYDVDMISSFKASELLILSTGCQGEQNATVAKIAHKKHKYINLEAGDLILFSSQIIPGNETAVMDLINIFIDRKINVITNKNAFIHVSGHPYKNEVRELYEILKPQAIIPMHGERIMLQEHVKLAIACGIKNSIIPKNGSVISIEKDGILKYEGDIEVDVMYLDSNRLIYENSLIINERISMRDNGVIVCNLVLNFKDEKLIKIPTIKSFGLLDYNSQRDMRIIKSLEEKLLRIVKDNLSVNQEEKKLINKIKGAISDHIITECGQKKPIIYVELTKNIN